mgnify:CR=1 FL=1
MLPSLQDLPGLLPGIFHRGDGAASEQSGRGLGQRQHVDHSHKGRDRLHLSPEAEAVKESLADDDVESVGEAAVKEAESKSLLGQAGGFVRKALETIRHDLSKALKAFGFDSNTVEQFTKAFVEPVLTALKEGVSFSAELSFAAFSQVTTTGAGGVSQSTTLVAQSLEIEVNRDTGEVSVSLAKLSFEEQFRATTGNGQQPLLVLDPDDLASPEELTQQILEGGVQPVETPEAAPADTPEGDAPEGEAAETEETAQPATEMEATLADVRKKLAEEAVELQTRLTIYSVSTYKNDKGESIIKMLLDAQLRVSALANEAPVQEEAESLNLTA